MNLKHLYTALACVVFNLVSHAQAPTANFTSDVVSGCSPIVVKFKDLSTGNPTSWLWDFGNGATSTLQNPSATYFEPGTYNVTLTATNLNGDHTETKQAYITVVNPPQIDFVSDKTSGCSPYTIQFSDQSVAATGTVNNAWFWDFGDGTQSTLQNPKKVYRTEDNFTVTLKVTNDKGCAKTITKPNYINITPGVVPAFTNSQSSVCSAPASVAFTNKSTGPGTITYSWDFGDGSTSTNASPSHTYIANGKYTVTLIASSSLGCADTLRKDTVVVIGGSITDFTVPNICAGGGEVQLTNASSPKPVSALWRFPDGTTSTEINPRKSFAGSGPVQVTLINKYGTCTDSVTKTVDISGKPAISFTTPDSVKCAPPSTVNFSNTTNGVTYKWDFGDSTSSTEANPSHTYADFGNYSVTLVATDDKGCTDTLKKPDFIKIQKPVISFPSLPFRGCIPYTNKFKADIKAVDKVTSYLWNFGDGTTSTLENPSHTYTQQGSYAVSLTITTSTGCTETLTLADAVKVGTKPKADFVADKFDVCASSPISFTNLSPMPTDEYIWKFGDGANSSVKNPKHEYSDTGFLHVTLIAFNSGCGDTLIKNNYVHIKPPIARFTFRPDCDQRNEITFENTSIIDPGLPVTWAWNFGDGTPVYAGQSPPPHRFPTRYGSWKVSLSVTNGSCSFTYSETIKIVDQTPDIRATVDAGCKPFRASMTAVSPVSLTKTVWKFGDGTADATRSGNSVTHTYFNIGAYDVTLTATDEFGCENSVTKDLLINVYGPKADFVSSTTEGCKGLTAAFQDNTTTDGQHPIVKWNWNYGDGKTETFSAPPFQHTYDTTGRFPVSMSVEDSYGCVDSIRKSNFIFISSIKAQWNVGNKQTCPEASVQFNNSTAGTYTSIWEFGDGTTSSSKSPAHAYADTGFYSVKLKVQDTVGCVDSLVRERYVQVGAPKASFTENNLVSFCTPFEAKFTNTSSYYTSRSWDLGIATSRQENPSVYYTVTGTHNVKLVVTSHGGCKDSVTKQLRVFNPEDAVLTYGPDLVGCRPVNVSFEAFAEMNASFVWDFGNGNVIDTTVNKIEHSYKDFGTFIPRIIMTESSGECKIALTGDDVIRVLGAKAKFGINQTLFCDSGYVQISDSTTYNDPIASFTWDYGDGTVSSNPDDTLHRYGSPGNYDVFLTVVTQNGCVDSLRSDPIKVVQSPLISMQSEFEICTNEWMRHAGVFERSDTSAVQWLWQFPNGNSASVQFPANQQYSIPGDYVVSAYVINSSGCADTAVHDIRVHPIPEVTMPSTLTMQAGFPVTLPATYTSNVTKYLWQPGATLSCSDCPQPIASPKFNTKYTVSFTDSNGCTNTGDIQVVVICMNANVFVPNTFSPNGDGSNDVFYVRGKGLERVKSLRIFNRWGEIVFEKRDFPVNDASAAWNGSFKGNRPQPDVYIYQVEVFCDNGEVIRFEGNVALIQ